MSTQNICFLEDIEKYQYFWIEKKSILSRAMYTIRTLFSCKNSLFVYGHFTIFMHNRWEDFIIELCWTKKELSS